MNIYLIRVVASCYLVALLYIPQYVTANCFFDTELLELKPTDQLKAPPTFGHAEKLIMIYMAADNDLRSFAIRNIRQLMNVGSEAPYMHIVVHLDIRDAQGAKITRRYYILPDDYIVLNEHDPKTQRMDSGDPNTLISFVQFAVDTFPTDTYTLIFWDHGTGYLDPVQHSRTNVTDLFSFNPTTHKLELDRTDLSAYYWHDDQRGVCWDQSTKNYLTAQKLDHALNSCTQYLGQPFDIIAFDACLMSMIEMADLISPYARIMVSSEEAILGTGFDYATTFAPLKENLFSVPLLAAHIVSIFDSTYNRITQDYELSALDLSITPLITENINTVALLLQEALSSQKRETVKRALKVARSNTVHFNEPGYLDLHDLYHNILQQLSNFKLKTNQTKKTALETALREGMALIDQYVIAHCAGTKLQHARGVSIYFPERMHSSYPNSYFARSYEWYNFLRVYLSA